jgi:hypothetical protein
VKTVGTLINLAMETFQSHDRDERVQTINWQQVFDAPKLKYSEIKLTGIVSSQYRNVENLNSFVSKNYYVLSYKRV